MQSGQRRSRFNVSVENRYLLSPAIDDAHFAVDGLHAAIEDTVDTASPAGPLIKRLLPHDPTGETLRLLEQLNGGNRPNTQLGVWSSKDGARALLLAQTRAAVSTSMGSKHAMQRSSRPSPWPSGSRSVRDPRSSWHGRPGRILGSYRATPSRTR